MRCRAGHSYLFPLLSLPLVILGKSLLTICSADKVLVGIIFYKSCRPHWYDPADIYCGISDICLDTADSADIHAKKNNDFKMSMLTNM